MLSCQQWPPALPAFAQFGGDLRTPTEEFATAVPKVLVGSYDYDIIPATAITTIVPSWKK
jgi:hypothetical protein